MPSAGLGRTYIGLLAAALGRDELADRQFARAIEVRERDGMLQRAARARLGWAEALAARGEHGSGFIEPRAAGIVSGAGELSPGG